MKNFPILFSPSDKRHKNEFIPWEIIETHREQAIKNHGQTLERLAERGGLSYRELYAVLNDKEYDYQNKDKYSDVNYELAVLRILRDFYTKS